MLTEMVSAFCGALNVVIMDPQCDMVTEVHLHHLQHPDL